MISVTYIQHVGDSLTVVNAARVSFGNKKQKLEEKDKKLIKYLAQHQHMSPFEHLTLTVKITCPLYIRSQIHRHRTFSYNEISRRYTDKDMEFFLPEKYREQHSSNRQASAGNVEQDLSNILIDMTKKHHEDSLKLYYTLLSNGVCKEQARGVLPQNLLTEFYMTGNLRNWAHFVKLREHAGAQIEVQEIAKEIKSVLISKFEFAAQELLNE